MASVTVQLFVCQRWWLRAYLAGVLLTSRLTGLEPDMVKVARWIDRGVYIKAAR